MYRNNIGYRSYKDEPDHIRKIRQSCPDNLKKMQMSYDECRILSLLLKMIKAERVLELGTLVGCSTAWIANSLSGHNPKVVSIEKSQNNYQLAVDNIKSAGLDNIVELINCDALEALKSYIGKPLFDAVFIDAKKVEYKKYLDLTKQIVRPGGLIIADNTLMIENTSDAISNAIIGFNQSVEDDQELESAMLPTVAGMTVMIRK